MAQLDHSKNWSSISNTNRPHPGGPDGKRKYYNDEKDLPSSQIGLRKITLFEAYTSQDHHKWQTTSTISQASQKRISDPRAGILGQPRARGLVRLIYTFIEEFRHDIPLVMHACGTTSRPAKVARGVIYVKIWSPLLFLIWLGACSQG